MDGSAKPGGGLNSFSDERGFYISPHLTAHRHYLNQNHETDTITKPQIHSRQTTGGKHEPYFNQETKLSILVPILSNEWEANPEIYKRNKKIASAYQG